MSSTDNKEQAATAPEKAPATETTHEEKFFPARRYLTPPFFPPSDFMPYLLPKG